MRVTRSTRQKLGARLSEGSWRERHPAFTPWRVLPARARFEIALRVGADNRPVAVVARLSGRAGRFGMTHHEPNSISVQPGEIKELTWRFGDAGTVIYACREPSHYQAGMYGEIILG